MSSRIRFHLDEQVKSVIARELRRRNIDVTTTVEAGLRTQSDEVQLDFYLSRTTSAFHSG
ncbi:MAG: hypothetical protein WCA35_30585 [Kovacikia sp.]